MSFWPGKLLLLGTLFLHALPSSAFAATSGGITCEPSPQCALELAREWGRSRGDDVLFLTLTSLLPAVARHGSRADLDFELQAWSAQFAALHGSAEEVPIAPSRALTIAGRIDEAVARVKACTNSEVAVVAAHGIAGELVPAGKVKEAAATWLALVKEDRARAIGSLLHELERDGSPPGAVREFVALSGFDPDSPSAPTFPWVLAADIARGDIASATRLANASDDPAKWLMHIARAHVGHKDFPAARTVLVQSAHGLRQVRDKEYRLDLIATLVQLYLDAQDPRAALAWSSELPPETRSEALARIVDQLAWLDLPAASSAAAQIAKAHSASQLQARLPLVAAGIVNDPDSRAGLEGFPFRRLRGSALARAALELAPRSPDAAEALLTEGIALIASDPDAGGRDVAWFDLADALASKGRYDTAYAIAGRIESPGFRTRRIAELATRQFHDGEVAAAQGRLRALLGAQETATPGQTAAVASRATEIGLQDAAFESLVGLRSRMQGDRNLDEPELFEAKLATAAALAHNGKGEQALALAISAEYAGERIWEAVYSALATRPEIAPRQVESKSRPVPFF